MEPNPGAEEARAVHDAALDRLGTAGRARMTFELSNNLRRLVESGIRLRHPDYDERKVRLAALKLAVGPVLFREAFPAEDIEP